MNIRPTVAGDGPEIARLLRQLHPDAPGPLRAPAIRQGARSVVATDGDEIAGFALATFVHYGLSSYGMIEELVVDAAHRGQGIGTALVQTCRQWLAQQEIQVVFVSALDDAAEAFYAHCGFARCTGAWLYWAPQEDHR